MSVFKEHRTNADRSVSDRRRHKSKIEKAIKDGIHHIVAEESIIGKDGKKKIKIPVKGIKEYRFIYGDNGNKKVGSAPGKNIKRGQKVGSKQQGQEQAPGGKPGKDKGEEYYEVEITLEELSNYLFDDLQLPELEKKRMKKLLSEKPKRHGYRNKGIRPRLDKKETVKKMLRRRNSAKRAGSTDDEEEFSFNERDLRYKHIKKKTKEHSNAVIFFVMDVSGSMTQDKKYLARSFFFLLYHFVRSKYENTDIVFIAHDVEAHEVDEEKFFKRGNGGGTIVSSGIELIKNIVQKRYHPNSWNVYVFQCSDGDNWPTDNNKVINLLEKLKPSCQFYGYCEIEPEGDRLKWQDLSSLSTVYKTLIDDRFKIATITSPLDIWPAFKTFFGGRLADV
jgi:sporulation protein YhbH